MGEDYCASAAKDLVFVSVVSEGTLGDPGFPRKFQTVDRLDDLLGVPVKVRKLEPWNSVRVTLSVPRDAALRLRQLAQRGAHELSALGILGVQLDGEGALQLKVAPPQGHAQATPTTAAAPSRPQDASGGGSPAAAATTTTTAFKSPNVVCPQDSVVPVPQGNGVQVPQTVVGATGAGSIGGGSLTNKPPYAGPFPFASMNQAIHSQSSGSNSSTTGSPNPQPPKPRPLEAPPLLPPPYPGVRRPSSSIPTLPSVRNTPPPARVDSSSPTTPPVTISSPLLVNLLQNDQAAAPGKPMRPPPLPQQSSALSAAPSSGCLKTAAVTSSSSSSHAASVLVNMSNNNNNSSNGSSNSSLSSSSGSSPSAFISTNAVGGATSNNAPPQQVIGGFGVGRSGQHEQQQQGGRVHYQRTPQGSIIALNKPLQSSVPLHSHQQSLQQRTAPTPTPNLLQSQYGGTLQKTVAFPPNRQIAQQHTVKMAQNGNSALIGTPPAISGGLNIGMGQQQQQQHQIHDILNHQVVPQTSTTKPLPSPPPYSVAVSSRPHWESIVSNPATLLDLTPSLTDLKPDELDDLLPVLGHSPLPELSELELLGGPHSGSSGTENGTTDADGRKFLINPLTGELEPHSSEESDAEDVKDVFTDLPSPLGLSDEDTNSTTRPDTTTDQSDSETRSSNDGKHPRVKNAKSRREGRDSPALKPNEKIKLRLKLEKSEPVNPAYKVDISFVNTQQPKKAAASIVQTTLSSSSAPGGVEELRVPPLHISLRGRNSAVIKNKSKSSEGSSAKKVRKMQAKAREAAGTGNEDDHQSTETTASSDNTHKKTKKTKSNHDHRELLSALSDDPVKFALHNHYKDKQKERRGSDSELARLGGQAGGRKHDANGALTGDEKRRRLSQSEGERLRDDETPTVPGSTNVGTVGVLPQKPRKDKIKIKESFKVKDLNRKLYAAVTTKNTEKSLQKSSVTLPTASDVDMEAKIKQSLMEGVIGEKGVPRPPHRTVEIVGHAMTDPACGRPVITPEKISKSPLNAVTSQTKEKTPEPDKCNVPDRKTSSSSVAEALQEKQLNAIVTTTAGGNRSPNSGSNGGQGEDSGIESMDALSEKSPNQASQSPHGDILPNVLPPSSGTTKTHHQVPDMLDIESQLAKMEGLDASSVPPTSKPRTPGSDSKGGGASAQQGGQGGTAVEDVNENECEHRSDSKACCDLACQLQDKMASEEELKDSKGIGLKNTGKDDQPSPNSPPSLRVAPALYTYPTNPGDKGGGGGGHDSRGGSESPVLTTTEDEDSNLGPASAVPEHPQQANNKGKSLLEQLLIEIPSEHHGAGTPSSHSPATRSSVRTRALSKLGSPELSSPVPNKSSGNKTAQVNTVSAAKRKRNESDSSNHSLEETRKRPRKGSEASEMGKRPPPTSNTLGVSKKNNAKTGGQSQQDESSDSDEPLIEKLRKTAPKTASKIPKVVPVIPANQASAPGAVNNKTNTRRSARAGHLQKEEKQQQPAQNTRSREKGAQQHQAAQQQTVAHGVTTHSNAEAEAALRRKTRSADVESKRKKEVK